MNVTEGIKLIKEHYKFFLGLLLFFILFISWLTAKGGFFKWVQ